MGTKEQSLGLCKGHDCTDSKARTLFLVLLSVQSCPSQRPGLCEGHDYTDSKTRTLFLTVFTCTLYNSPYEQTAQCYYISVTRQWSRTETGPFDRAHFSFHYHSFQVARRILSSFRGSDRTGCLHSFSHVSCFRLSLWRM
jgi:hypothetical protein